MAFPTACFPKTNTALQGAGFVGPLDGYTADLAGAWSVARRLLSSYSGALIKVRRSSDNVEQDIGFNASNELDVEALALFVGSASGFVTKLYDQSGNGYDAVQLSASSQPRCVDLGGIDHLGDKPGMVLDGESYSMNISTLQSTGVAAYSCALKSAGTTWNNYGAIIGNTNSGSRLGLMSVFTTEWWSDPFPEAVRRNGVILSSPFDCAPIDTPMVLGVDCHVTILAGDINIGNTENLYWLACTISEIAAWSSTADRSVFESNQMAFFGL